MTFWNRFAVVWLILTTAALGLAVGLREPWAYVMLGASTVMLGVVLYFRHRTERKYR